MAKKKSNYTNNSSRRFYVETIMGNNKDLQAESALRYALEHDVSTPEVTISSHDPAYYNPAIYELTTIYKDSNSSRQKEIDKHPKIPYIKDKEIRLTKGLFNTGKISTNLLDSIYDSAQRVGIPFEEALGLAGRESTLDIGRGFKEGTEISPTELMSNWQQVQDIINTNSDIKRRNRIIKDYYNNKPINQEDIDFFEKFQKNEQKETDSTRPIKEHPLDNALKLFMSGKYNIGDSNHTNMVKREGKTLMAEPAIQKWMKENNKHSLGGWFAGLGSKLDGLNANLTDSFFDSKFGQGLSGFGIKAGNIGGMANTAATAIGGLLAGQNKTGVGTALQGIGSLASNIPGVGGLIGAGVNLIGGLTNAAFGSNINKDFVNRTETQARQQSNYVSGASDNASLLADWEALTFLDRVKKDDVGSEGWLSDKATDETNRLNGVIDNANARALVSYNNTADNIDRQKDLMLKANYGAYGGPINMRYTGTMSPFGNQFDEGGNLFTNGVTTINNGGTHEENPYEGVQMGIDPQGIPNLVEEGEVIYDDYVFSNRLRVPKEVRQKYKLRGVTFADAAKQLQKESEERPNDPISKNGLEASMQMLTNEQEKVRMEKENNKYAKGGRLCKKYEGTGPYSQYLELMPKLSVNIPKYDKGFMQVPTIESPVGTHPMEKSLSYTDFLVNKNKNNYKSLLPYTSKGSDKSNEIQDSFLRKMPIVGHSIGVFSDLFSSPDYSAANRIDSVDIVPSMVGFTPVGNYLEYTPFDKDRYINTLNANTNAGKRAIMNTSGGNRAAAMAGLLSADYNHGNQLGELARKAEEYNLAQRQAVEQFNRGTNMTNAEMGLKAAMANADSKNKATQLRLAQAETVAKLEQLARDTYNTRRSNNLNVLLEDLEGLGTENWNRAWLDRLAKAGVLKIDSKGNFIIPKEDSKKSNGGRIKTKKKKGLTYG